MFSQDPEAVKKEASFLPLYEFFTPFFFIVICLDIEISSIGGGSLVLFAALASAAIFGKVLANDIPLWLMKDFPSALLLGVSMVPRDEITMVIMQKGSQLGSDILPPVLFSAMALVSILTCGLTPVVVSHIFKNRPQGNE